MAERDDVCVLIPTLNEAKTIGDVIDRFHAEGFENVLVIDGRSTDETRQIAEERGARVVVQSGKGKGQAVREALDLVQSEIVLMLDGDGTYRPEDAEEMLAPILDGEYEHVIGNRFADMDDDAMSRLNTVGNHLINWSFRTIHGRDFVDILSGYRAFTMSSTRLLRLESDGFGVETELAVECVKHNVPTAIVPIRYVSRPGESETNLHPVKDGGVILLTLYRLAKTNNPLFYFGSVGVLSILFGLLFALYVGVEWVTRHVSHDVIAVVGGIAILFGVQLLMFGVLSDMIITLHREQIRRLETVIDRGRVEQVTPDDGFDANAPSDATRDDATDPTSRDEELLTSGEEP